MFITILSGFFVFAFKINHFIWLRTENIAIVIILIILNIVLGKQLINQLIGLNDAKKQLKKLSENVTAF
jgi:regulatory protein YycI of two-component signal transduction system YycFG